jgi:hypothetical protein
MRSGGFPCRFAGCERTFRVEDQSSMAALAASSAARTQHELEAHGYRHQSQPEPARMPYVPRRVEGKP